MTESLETRWYVYPTRHSVAFVPTGADNRLILDKTRYLVPEDRGTMVSDEVFFRHHFRTQEVDEIFDPRGVAATYFGPPQEKASNEDFALSAIIRATDGTFYSFAAVADGVSTRTFWAARAARLSCLTAYWSLSCLLTGDLDLGDPKAAEQLMDRFTDDLRETLDADRQGLIKLA